MAGIKTFVTLLAVLFVAAATIWMAFQVTGVGMPVGMAVAGPVLLILAVVVHWIGRRK